MAERRFALITDELNAALALVDQQLANLQSSSTETSRRPRRGGAQAEKRAKLKQRRRDLLLFKDSVIHFLHRACASAKPALSEGARERCFNAAADVFRRGYDAFEKEGWLSGDVQKALVTPQVSDYAYDDDQKRIVTKAQLRSKRLRKQPVAVAGVVEEERKRHDDEVAQRKKEEEAERKRKQEAEAEKKRKQEAEAEKKRKKEEEAEKKRKREAEAENKRKKEEEAERKRKKEAEAEKKRKKEAEAERKRKKEAEDVDAAAHSAVSFQRQIKHSDELQRLGLKQRCTAIDVSPAQMRVLKSLQSGKIDVSFAGTAQGRHQTQSVLCALSPDVLVVRGYPNVDLTDEEMLHEQEGALEQDSHDVFQKNAFLMIAFSVEQREPRLLLRPLGEVVVDSAYYGLKPSRFVMREDAPTIDVETDVANREVRMKLQRAVPAKMLMDVMVRTTAKKRAVTATVENCFEDVDDPQWGWREHSESKAHAEKQLKCATGDVEQSKIFFAPYTEYFNAMVDVDDDGCMPVLRNDELDRYFIALFDELHSTAESRWVALKKLNGTIRLSGTKNKPFAVTLRTEHVSLDSPKNAFVPLADDATVKYGRFSTGVVLNVGFLPSKTAKVPQNIGTLKILSDKSNFDVFLFEVNENVIAPRHRVKTSKRRGGTGIEHFAGEALPNESMERDEYDGLRRVAGIRNDKSTIELNTFRSVLRMAAKIARVHMARRKLQFLLSMDSYYVDPTAKSHLLADDRLGTMYHKSKRQACRTLTTQIEAPKQASSSSHTRVGTTKETTVRKQTEALKKEMASKKEKYVTRASYRPDGS